MQTRAGVLAEPLCQSCARQVPCLYPPRGSHQQTAAGGGEAVLVVLLPGWGTAAPGRAQSCSSSLLPCIMFLLLHLATGQGSLNTSFSQQVGLLLPSRPHDWQLGVPCCPLSPETRSVQACTNLPQPSSSSPWVSGKGDFGELSLDTKRSWPRRGCQAFSSRQHGFSLRGKKGSMCHPPFSKLRLAETKQL